MQVQGGQSAQAAATAAAKAIGTAIAQAYTSAAGSVSVTGAGSGTANAAASAAATANVLLRPCALTCPLNPLLHLFLALLWSLKCRMLGKHLINAYYIHDLDVGCGQATATAFVEAISKVGTPVCLGARLLHCKVL